MKHVKSGQKKSELQVAEEECVVVKEISSIKKKSSTLP